VGLSFFDILLIGIPIAIIGAVYWLLQRFKKRPLSFPIRWAFLVTLGILTAWGVVSLFVIATGSGFIRALLLVWVIYFIPVFFGTFILTWSVLTLAQPKTAGRGIGRGFAIGFIALAVLLGMFYVYSEQQCRIASSPVSEPERLRTLYHSWYGKFDDNIARSLARNTATPEDVLLLLAKHGDVTSRVNLCHNPSTPLSILELLAGDKEWRVRGCVIFHKNVSVVLLRQLAHDPSSDVRRSVAGKETSPVELLLKLAHDESESVLMTLAQNKTAPLEAVEILMQHKSAKVRRMLASRDDLPLELKLTLAEDESVEVRRQLISELNVPVAVLEKLKDDPDSQIQQRVWERFRYLRRQKK